MDKFEKFIVAVENANTTFSKVADSLGVSLKELLIKVINDFDFFSQEMLVLTKILNLKDPYAFFYE